MSKDLTFSRVIFFSSWLSYSTDEVQGLIKGDFADFAWDYA
jgi:hypothetical protein